MNTHFSQKVEQTKQNNNDENNMNYHKIIQTKYNI